MAHFIQRKKGWGVRFYVEIGEKQEQVYLFEKGWEKKDAENAMNEFKYKASKNLVVKPQNFSLQQLLEQWYADFVEHNLALRTRRSYAEVMRLHVIPVLGSIKLRSLTASEIQAYYTKMLRSGLSSTTVLYHHRVLKMALKYAVQLQYMSTNPAESVKPPRKNKTNIQVLSDVQVKLLLQEVIGKPVFLPVYIALTTGMRRGEVCGLQLDDIDLDNEKFTVRYCYQLAAGELKLWPLKTDGSRRSIPMLPGTKKVLQNYFDQRNINKEACPGYKESTFLCIWPDGHPLDPDYVYKSFKKACKKLNFPEFRFHDLRHTHATMLLRQGVHPKIVSERLGHTRVNITLDTYSHVLPELQKDVISRLDLNPFKNLPLIEKKQELLPKSPDKK